MKVTIVMDNCISMKGKLPYRAEHGLSMLIETKHSKFLLDTGQSDLILHNLSLLDIHPSNIDGIIISHGHYDHTGGLESVLLHAKKTIPVYANMGIFMPRYSISGGKRRYIGIPAAQERLNSLGADFKFISAPTKINDDLILSGPVIRDTTYEYGDDNLVLSDGNGSYTKDIIRDDLAIYCPTDNGLTILTGCAHAGIVNIINQGLRTTGKTKLVGIIGGTHLGPAKKEQQDETIQVLERMNPDFIAANHCTGFDMMARLQQVFGKRFEPAFVGTMFDVI